MGGIFSYPYIPNVLPLKAIENIIPSNMLMNPISTILYQAQLHLTFLSVRVIYQARLATKLASKYDNINPRSQILKFISHDTRFAQLHGAYMNGMEYFPLYIAAVLSCLVADVNQDKVKRMATSAVLLRILYYGFYSTQHTAGGAALRSLSWCLGVAQACQMIRVAALEYNEK